MRHNLYKRFYPVPRQVNSLVEIIDTKDVTIQQIGNSKGALFPHDWASITDMEEIGQEIEVHLCHDEEYGYHLAFSKKGEQPKRNNGK